MFCFTFIEGKFKASLNNGSWLVIFILSSQNSKLPYEGLVRTLFPNEGFVRALLHDITMK